MEESEQLYWDAEIYRETDLFEQALPLYERVQELAPDFYQALRGKAIVLRQLGRREEALAFAKRSIEINPNYADGWRAVGAILRDNQRHEEGLDCYKRGLQIDSSDIVLWSNLAKTLGTLGRLEEAKGAFRNALAHIPATAVLAVQLYREGSDQNSSTTFSGFIKAIPLLKSLIELSNGRFRASFQDLLGSVYHDLPRGDHGQNLSRAIACFEAALEVHTESDFPAEWAKTQHNLGVVYRKLPRGNRGENLSRAIACFDAALRVFTERDFSAEWAGIQNNLGNAYGDLPYGDRGENLQRAIVCFDAALRVFTERDFSAEWAGIQNNLGNAYGGLPYGDRGENLQCAIACFDAALRVFTERDFPAEWAATQNNLGVAYQKLPRGDRGQNLSLAIACFGAALRVRTEKAFPVDWAGIQNNLGEAYGDLPSGDRGENLQRAIACYEAALRVRTEQDSPVEWAATQNNLGNAYSDLPRGDPSENLLRAIACFEAALRVFTERDFSAEWAGIQNNLGNAYRHLPSGDRGENLQRAIACYEAALRVRTEQDSPVEWAGTLNSLGEAYGNPPRGDPTENLLRAIACCEAALRVYTEQDSPVEWAEIQNNLGNAYSDLPRGDPSENLLRAIACFEAALRVFTERAFPFEWAGTQNNLGAVYEKLQRGDRSENLLRAIACFDAALRVFTERDFPGEWAATQNNLGNAYSDLPRGDPSENLLRAIACFDAALRVHTEKDSPVEWAVIQNNLGNAYGDLPRGDPSENLQRAIACYEASLRVYTPEHLPIKCQGVLDNLGALYFNENDYERALPLLLTSISVMDTIRIEALEDAERSRILSGSERTFEQAIFSALQTRRYATAFTVAERGKTRNLADHLWRLDQKLPHAAPEDWRSYQEHLTRASLMERTISSEAGKIEPHPGPKQSRSMAGQQGNERQDQVAMLEGLAQVRRDIRRMENQFAEGDPDYTPFAKPLGSSEILALALESEAVIVDFRVSNSRTYAFLAGPSDSDITEGQVIELPDLTNDALFHFVSEWLISHYTRKEWTTYLTKACGRIYQLVFSSVHARLRKLYPDLKRLILIPSRGLALLPLHAAQWESEGKTRYLMDEYEISYAPSCHVLQRCLARQREKPAAATSLLAVQNPDGSLPFSDWEVEGAAQHFPAERRTILPGAKATGDRVRESLEFGEEKLFSCHGYFDIQEVQNSYLALHERDRLSLANILPASLRGTWLVVLSACVSGLSDVFDQQDEYNGLPAAFLLGGAQTVVSTMFSVGDLPTALLSQRFHENLYDRKMAKASALNEAQLWLRDLSIDEADALLRSKQHELAPETYTRLRDRWDQITQRMSVHDSVTARFDLRARGMHPFTNPAHWAGFYCVGAGW